MSSLPSQTNSPANPLSSEALANSYGFCRAVAKTRAKNFYYSFLLLDKPQRDGMCAIYAFMRHCDDLSDDPASRDPLQLRYAINDWRRQLDAALAGDVSGHALWPAFSDTVSRYAIPHRYFHEMIDGILSDVEPEEIETFDQLYRYCYRVASVVGLTVTHIFRFRSPKALLLAEKCGVAFQLTNILRDVREDAEMGRCYLPLEDRKRFSISFEQLQSGTEDDPFRALMRWEADRAQGYYDESAPLLDMVEPKSRRSLWALRAIYLRLLRDIRRNDFSVLSKRISVPKPVRVGILLSAFFR